MKKLAIFVVLAFSAAAVFAQDVPAPSKFKKTVIQPKDESSKDPALKKAIDQMKTAVKNKDAAAVKKLCSKNITWSFGDDPGVDGFFQNYQLDKNSKTSEFWRIMDFLLKNGGTYDPELKSYSVPYWFSSMTVPSDMDPDTYYMQFYVTAGKNVNIRKTPSSKGDVIAKLSYEMIYIIEWTDNEETVAGVTGNWVKIKMSDGKQGYVFSQFIYGPYDYRAVFAKESGQWKMTVFVAGD